MLKGEKLERLQHIGWQLTRTLKVSTERWLCTIIDEIGFHFIMKRKQERNNTVKFRIRLGLLKSNQIDLSGDYMVISVWMKVIYMEYGI